MEEEDTVGKILLFDRPGEEQVEKRKKLVEELWKERARRIGRLE